MGHGKIINSLIRLFLCFCMINTMVMPSYSQTLNLPQPGTMAQLSASYTPVLLKGVQINIKNPFEFNFIIGQSDDAWLEGQFRQEADKLIKYFLATLTTPEKDMWVNLSPYEKDRIIPEAFGSTDMGRDMLAQDYLLKQITATLLYPEEELGRKFWDKVYEKAFERYGTSEIPMDSFHKVWIVPDVAQVYENGDRAFITQSRLKVLLEEDYLAISKSSSQENGRAESSRNDMGTEIMRSIIIPELEREVNEGAHFASLRQLYSSLILATWYKKKLRQSILSEVYVDQNKIVGIERSNVLTAKSEDSTESRDDVDVIYDQYVEAFQKGVFNYIKEEEGLLTQDVILRHYFSGGVDIRRFSSESMTLDGQAKDVNLDDAMIVNALIDPISDEKEARQRRVYEAYLGELSADDREAILWQRLEVNHAREVPSKEKYRQVASALAHLGRAAGNWWRFSQLLPFITPQNMSRALEQELIMYINQGSVGNRDLYNGFYSFDVELARLNALLRYAKKNSNFNPLADRLLKLLELSKMDSRVESLLFEFMGSIDQQEKERLNVILSSSFSLYYPSYEYDGEKRRSHNLMIGLVLRLRLFMDPKYSLRQRFETPPLKDGDLEVLLNVDTEEAWALIVEGYAARALVEENNIGKKDAYAIAIREAGRQQQALEYIRREYTPYKKGSPKFITQNVYRIASLDTEAAYDFVLDMLSENTIHSGDLEFFRAMVDLKEGLSFSRYANAYGNNMTGQYALQFRDALSTRLTEGQQMRLRSVIANLPQLNIPVAFLPEMFPEIGRVGDVIPISSEMSIEIWRPRRTENSIKVVDRLKELMDSSGIEGDERMRWEDLEEELNSEYNRTYLFRNAEGEIVAFGIVSIPNKPWESFGGIMVSDEGRYQHLGRRMLNKSLEDYKTLGRKIFRFVAADSTNVSKYYELYGRRILRRGYSLVIEKRLSEGAFFNYVDIFFPGTDQDGFTDIVKLAHERTDAAGGDAAMVGSDSREYQLKKHTFWVESSLNKLLGRLMDTAAYVRARSANELAILAEGKLITAASIPKVVDGLLGGLMDRDTEVRTGSAEGLAILAQGKLITAESIPKVVDGLLGGLMDADVYVRTRSEKGVAILAQGKLITAESIPQEKLGRLLGELMNSDANVRRRSAKALVILAEGKLITAESIPKVVDGLLGGLMDTDTYVRTKSAEGLMLLAQGKLIPAESIPKVVDGLLGGLMDSDADVRTKSAEGLVILAQGKLITAESIPQEKLDGLLWGLMDIDSYVRTRSAEGLVILADGKLIPAESIPQEKLDGLLGGLMDGNAIVFKRSAEGLAILAQGKLITAESIPQEKLDGLLGGLMGSYADGRKRSAEGLAILAQGKLITAESIPQEKLDGLLGGLLDSGAEVRTRSVEGLAILAQGKLITAESILKVVDGLLGGLMDSDAYVRYISAKGLVILAQGKLITAESIPQEKLGRLLGELMNLDANVRTKSAEGLAILAQGKLITAESIPQEKLGGLLGGLMDTDADVRTKSAEGLAILAQGKLITAESIPQEKLDGLLGGLMDSYTDRRKRSAEGLAILAQGKLITAESIPQEKLGGLLGGLMDTDADVRTKSAEGLKILNTMFGEPIIDVFDASDKNILFMKNIHHLLLESFVDVLKNGQVSSSIFHNRLDYLTDYMIEGKYELDSELRNKISDAVAYAYPNVGGHLDTMIRFLEQQNILTNQETNRIVGAFGAWGINEGGDLPQGSRGYVQYRAFGFSGQGVELGGGQLLGPQVKFEWHYPKQRNDQGGYQQEAPQGRFGYRRMRMSDDKGNAQEMIGFLGRQLDSSDKKETGIYDLREDNGDVEATVLKEGYHKAKHYQIYRLGDDETLRKRQVMRMTRKDGSFYHIAPLGYDKNLTFAYYQIVESGAVFKACIDASHLKQMLNEEKVRFKDDFDYHELSFASERAWRFISKVKKSLKEIQQESIKADEQSVSDAYYVDSEEEYDRLVSDMKNMIGYLINEGFIQEHLGGNPLDGVELENLSRDEVLEWSAFIIEAFEKVNKLDLLSPFLPENMIVKGYVLGRLNNARLNASQLREYLGTMVSILNDEMGTNYNLDDVAEEDRLKQSVKILSTFDKYVQQARMLGDLSKVLSYNPVSAVEMALESLTIGNATHRVGGVDSSWEEVRHYPVFEILENVSKPGIKPVVESQGVYGYVEIDENLRDQDIQVQEKRTQIYLKGRSIVMTQGVTMREALEGVGLSLDDDRYNVLFEGGVDERLNERFVIKIEAVGVGENDRAMKTDKVGGIDFDANKFDLQVENDGAMSTFEFDVEAIRNMQIDGFRPVIIDITPVRNIPALLGLNDDERDGDEPIQISLSQYFIKSDQDIFV